MTDKLIEPTQYWAENTNDGDFESMPFTTLEVGDDFPFEGSVVDICNEIPSGEAGYHLLMRWRVKKMDGSGELGTVGIMETVLAKGRVRDPEPDEIPENFNVDTLDSITAALEKAEVLEKFIADGPVKFIEEYIQYVRDAAPEAPDITAPEFLAILFENMIQESVAHIALSMIRDSLAEGSEKVTIH